MFQKNDRLFNRKKKSIFHNKLFIALILVILFITLIKPELNKHREQSQQENQGSKIAKIQKSIEEKVHDKVMNMAIKQDQGLSAKINREHFKKSKDSPEELRYNLIKRLATDEEFKNHFYDQLRKHLSNKSKIQETINGYEEEIANFQRTKYYFEDIKIGKGKMEAVCGSNVVVKYDLYAGDQRLAKDVLYDFKVDSHEGFYETVYGLREGGLRNIFVTEKMPNIPEKIKQYFNYAKQLRLETILVNSSFRKARAKDKISIFDRFEVGTREVKCGDRVKITMEVRKIDDEINNLKELVNFTFTLGKDEVPDGVEIAIIGMKRGSARVALLPKELLITSSKMPYDIQRSFNSKHNAFIEISKLTF